MPPNIASTDVGVPPRRVHGVLVCSANSTLLNETPTQLWERYGGMHKAARRPVPGLFSLGDRFADRCENIGGGKAAPGEERLKPALLCLGREMTHSADPLPGKGGYLRPAVRALPIDHRFHRPISEAAVHALLKQLRQDSRGPKSLTEADRSEMLGKVPVVQQARALEPPDGICRCIGTMSLGPQPQ